MIKRKRYSKFEKWLIALFLNMRYRIIVFSLLFWMFSSLPSWPYFNLFISKDLMVFLIISSFMVVFNTRIKVVLILTLLFLFLSFLFILIDEHDAAEFLGNFVYGFLFVGVILYIFQMFRNQRN